MIACEKQAVANLKNLSNRPSNNAYFQDKYFPTSSASMNKNMHPASHRSKGFLSKQSSLQLTDESTSTPGTSMKDIALPIHLSNAL